MLGTFWIIVGYLWGQFGIMSGTFWGHIGIMLGSLWDHYGINMALVGASVGAIWETFYCKFRASEFLLGTGTLHFREVSLTY